MHRKIGLVVCFLVGSKQFAVLGWAIPGALEHRLPVDIGDDLHAIL